MFQMSYEDIVKRIQEEKKLSREEIDKKIEQKISSLNDLISRQGAAHIVANQLGIKVMEMPSDSVTKVSEIPVGVNSVNSAVKVISMYGVREFNKQGRSGKVANFLSGDETGSIRVVVWDENLIKEIENGDVKEGDILKIRNAYSKDNNGYKELHLGSKSIIEINPEGVSINEVKRGTVNASRKKINELKEGETAEIFGTVVQLFEPRFYYTCPNCGKKAFLEDMKYKCVQHGEVEAKKVPVLNFFLDDGTSNIRVVAFNKQAEQLTQKEDLDVNTEEFEKLKLDVLGKQVLVSGRCNKNTMFDRLEFVCMDVKEANPVEIINEI